MNLVVFDLDGTLLAGQSQRLLLSYLRRSGHIGLLRYIKIASWFSLYKLGLARDPRPIMQRAFSFLDGLDIHAVEELSARFFEREIKPRIYREALDLVDRHRASNGHVIIVSNAVDIIVREVARYIKADGFISTRLECEAGVYTGSIAGEIMYGPAKARAMTDYAADHQIGAADIWAYGDHESDAPMLALAGHPGATNPTPPLRVLARKQGWPVLSFRR